MQEYKCASCPLRAKYEKSPKSFIGRFWRWHINFCPGWRAYFNSLEPAEQENIRTRYNFSKY
ncbi:MAG: hypothetical protein J6K81_06010 [Rikenellaceae bacterium]|nr:hypothetical protein [Rikenellaceae bacterium]